MPARNTRRQPGPQPLADPDAVQLADDQFAMDLASDNVALVDEQIRLIGDDNSDDADLDQGPLRPDQVEQMAAEEVSEVLAGFKARERQEAQRFEDATDTEYWFALCFQTREQKEQFLVKIGWINFGDKYLDGMACAEAVNITLDARIPPMPRQNIDRQLADLTE